MMHSFLAHELWELGYAGAFGRYRSIADVNATSVKYLGATTMPGSVACGADFQHPTAQVSQQLNTISERRRAGRGTNGTTLA